MEEFLEEIRNELKLKKKTYLKIKVSPNLSNTKVIQIGKENGEFILKIGVNAKPKNGEANQELIRFLKKIFPAVPKIIAGSAQSVKLVKLSRE